MKHIKPLLALLALSFTASCTKDGGEHPQPSGKTYIIISDLHLGDSRSVTEGYGWNSQMKDTVSAFLDYLVKDPDWDELVVAGDMFEEWTSPADVATMRDENGNPVSEADYFHKLVNDNREIFEKFGRLKDSGRKLVYIPGNHDMLTTSDDFGRCLPGLFEQARTAGVDGMGEYRPDGNIFIEHGHRYDILNAPYKGNCGVDGIPSSNILPPGFFICKLYTSHQPAIGTKVDKEGITYDIMWDGIGFLFGKEDVVTMIDGMDKTYPFKDYAGSETLLFNHINHLTSENDGWVMRCTRNRTFIVPSVNTSILSGLVYDFFDSMGMDVLESPEMEARILVWGHSHSPKLLSKDSAIYLNTGCWVDAAEAGAENTGTFGKITVSAEGEYEVSLCRFDLDGNGEGNITVLGSECL